MACLIRVYPYTVVTYARSLITANLSSSSVFIPMNISLPHKLQLVTYFPLKKFIPIYELQ